MIACNLQELAADHAFHTAKDSHSCSFSIFLFHFFLLFMPFCFYSEIYVGCSMAPRLIICDTDIQIDWFLTAEIRSLEMDKCSNSACTVKITNSALMCWGTWGVTRAISWTNCLWNYFRFPVSVFNMTDSFSPFQNDDLFFYCHCRIHYHKLQFSNLLLWTLESLFIRIIR